MKKLFCVALACVLMLSAMCIGASAAPAKVDGVLWFPCASNRQNDLFWEVECIKTDCVCQGFLDNETTTGNKNFLDTVYGADGSLTVTRNGNDGTDFYWPRVRTLLPMGTPEIDLNTANTLYFDLEANASWNVMLGFNGLTIKLSKAIADATGVSGVANSDADAPAGTFKGSINLPNTLEQLAAESGTESAPYAQAVKSMATAPLPQVTIFCIGGVGASVKINTLYLSSADDTTAANCTYADMALLTDDCYDDTAIMPTVGGTTQPTEPPTPVTGEGSLGDLAITLTADKQAYTATEDISVVLTAENIGNEPVANVNLDTVTPEGYQVKESGGAFEQGTALNPGDKATINVTFEPTATSTTAANSDTTTAAPTTTTVAKDTSKQDSPKTGDTSDALLAIVIAAGAVAAMMLAYKTRGGKQMLSIVLCLTLAFSSVAVLPMLTDAAGVESATVNVTVKVDGKDLVLSGVVSCGEETSTTVTTVITTTTTQASPEFDVTLPELPIEVKTLNYAGKHIASCTVDSMTYELDASGALALYFYTTKTFDSKGDDRSGACKIAYEIYDSNNNLVASETQATEALKVGESCLDPATCTAHKAITSLVPVNGESYRVVLLDA